MTKRDSSEYERDGKRSSLRGANIMEPRLLSIVKKFTLLGQIYTLVVSLSKLTLIPQREDIKDHGNEVDGPSQSTLGARGCFFPTRRWARHAKSWTQVLALLARFRAENSDTQGIRNHGRNEIRHRGQLTKARLSFQTETTGSKSSHGKSHVWQLMKRDFGVKERHQQRSTLTVFVAVRSLSMKIFKSHY